MKSSLMARPNLKLFLLGAALLLVVNDLIVGSGMRASARTLPIVGKAGEVTQAEIERLQRHVADYPSVEGYMRLADCHTGRGEYRQAMACLRRASELEDAALKAD